MNLSFLQKTSSLFLHIWGRWSDYKNWTLWQISRSAFRPFALNKGRQGKLRSYSSSPKTSKDPSQALFIKYLSEWVSVNRYPKGVLQKSWVSLILTVSWTGLNWLSKATTRNITAKDLGQKRITHFSIGKLLSTYNWNKACPRLLGRTKESPEN